MMNRRSLLRFLGLTPAVVAVAPFIRVELPALEPPGSALTRDLDEIMVGMREVFDRHVHEGVELPPSIPLFDPEASRRTWAQFAEAMARSNHERRRLLYGPTVDNRVVNVMPRAGEWRPC